MCVPEGSSTFRRCLSDVDLEGSTLGTDCRGRLIIHAKCDFACGDTKGTVVHAPAGGSCSVHTGVRRTNGLLCTTSGLIRPGPGSKRSCILTGVPFTRCIGTSFSFTGGFVVSPHGSFIFRVKIKITCPCNGSGVLPFRGECFSNNTGDMHK